MAKIKQPSYKFKGVKGTKISGKKIATPKTKSYKPTKNPVSKNVLLGGSSSRQFPKIGKDKVTSRRPKIQKGG